MLVRDLSRLVDSGEYRRCLDEATALLKVAEGLGLEEKARIYAAMCRCQLELTDYFGAVEAGELALQHATEAGAADLGGFVLSDLGRALLEIRQYDTALQILTRYFSEVPEFSASRCREGLVHLTMAGVLERLDRRREAMERYREAHRWFLRYGDLKAAADCLRAVVRVHLEHGEPEHAAAMLREGDLYAAEHPEDRVFLANHLLDRGFFHLAIGQYQVSIQEAFQGLEVADARLDQQSRAHMLLCQNALATNRPRDALNFAMAARVSAIDGRHYDLEFEASETLFRLLRERGARIIREIESDYYRRGVDIYHYLSERVIRRMLDTN